MIRSHGTKIELNKGEAVVDRSQISETLQRMLRTRGRLKMLLLVYILV